MVNVIGDELKECLLEVDGGFKDINFTPISKAALLKLLIIFCKEYDLKSADNHEGEDLKAHFEKMENLDVVFESEGGTVRAVFENKKSVISFIQFFVSWAWSDNIKTYEIELSFYPDDLDHEKFSLDEFMKKVHEWWDMSGAQAMFIRYENVSWENYDPSDPGIFYHVEKK